MKSSRETELSVTRFAGHAALQHGFYFNYFGTGFTKKTIKNKALNSINHLPHPKPKGSKNRLSQQHAQNSNAVNECSALNQPSAFMFCKPKPPAGRCADAQRHYWR
jgi:hypothetical protein